MIGSEFWLLRLELQRRELEMCSPAHSLRLSRYPALPDISYYTNITFSTAARLGWVWFG